MRVTASLDDEHQDELERLRDVESLTSDAAAVRLSLERSAELEDARERAEELENRVRELEQELMKTNRRIDATNEIVEWAEEEKSLAERRVEREEKERQRREEWRKAGWVTKLKWSMFGWDDDDDGDEDGPDESR